MFCHLYCTFEGERVVFYTEHMISYYLNETDITIFFGGGKIGIGNAAPLQPLKNRSAEMRRKRIRCCFILFFAGVLNLSCSIYSGGFATLHFYFYLDWRKLEALEKNTRFVLRCRNSVCLILSRAAASRKGLPHSAPMQIDWLLRGHANTICYVDQWQHWAHRHRD